MYLSKKTYVKKWSHQKPEEVFDVTITKGGNIYSNIDSNRVSYITEELMYWRKANNIHGWFCHNTEAITEDIRYYVSRDNLEELLSTCKQVIEILDGLPKVIKQVVGGFKNGEKYMDDVEVYDNTDDVMDLLPPTEGFFFGSDSIDGYYRESLVETIEFLEKELSSNDDEFPDYEYYASW